MKKYKINKKRFVIVIILVIILLSIIGIGIVRGIEELIYEPYYEIEKRDQNIKDTKYYDSQAYAWVRVQGTNIDTAVVHKTDEVDADIKIDYLWTSSNYEEGENRKVIYGHNVRNVSSYPELGNEDHFRFEQLMSFSYYDFAKENLYIQYNDGTGDSLYKIYAVSFNDGHIEYGQSYDKETTAEYIENARYESLYDYDVLVDENDELISLITCTRYFGLMEKTQFRVDARKVRANEKIVQYEVTKTSNYNVIQGD